ncbi:MAG TPA: PQQ-binding-like beta-propeller repeat protein [Xanthobacteraceae bacterium]|jgi:alcohol dehydrogenase (cytochrome c)|nr:PQQ-binding-like beta-propeller repeat protein [Xanthobacteraceae bacterium]
MRSHHHRSHHRHSLRAFLLATAALLAVAPAVAADVTSDRLVNADREPQNWLMNHRTYDAQRYSPLDKINKANIKDLKLAYAVAIGGTSPNENLESTPLAEDGFLYVVDQWGVLYKIDARSGDVGRIVWRMDPGQEKVPLANRGAALWGNFVVTVANYPARAIATNKETGKVAWETNLADGQADLQLTAAPLAVKDNILIGAAGGDRGVRDFIAALDGATGKMVWRKYVIPAPGEPGSETWKDKNNAWQTGGGAMWVTGSYDPDTNQLLWGTGNPVPMFDPYYRPGDNLYTNSLISWDPGTGKMNWYHQYIPGDMWDYDGAGTHILIDGQVAGQARKLVTHSGRNGFLYTFDRANGQTLLAKPYLETINWTKGIDQKTGLPVDYDPNRDIQIYSGGQNMTLADRTKKLCPSMSGGSNFWSASYSPRTKLLYIPSASSCNEVSLDPNLSNKAGDWKGATFKHIERNESDVIVADPFTGEVKKRIHSAYPNNSAALATAGGLVFTGLTDGTFIAYDDATFEPLWKINVGTGFDAPPMTFEAGGKQYVAILAGLSPIARRRHQFTPELREMRNQTMLFVFGL